MGWTFPLVAQAHGSSRIEIDEFFDNVPQMSSSQPETGLPGALSSMIRWVLTVTSFRACRNRGDGHSIISSTSLASTVHPTAEFPVPYALAQRLKRALGLDLDALNTLGGFVSPPIKKRSGMQEVYRRFLLEPELSEEELVARVAEDLGGEECRDLLLTIWKDIHRAVEQNGRQIGFALGTEYASRRTLVRPLVPEPSALSPEESEWALAYTFAGNLRYGHAHLFRGEGGTPSTSWYELNRDRSLRAKRVFQQTLFPA